MTLLFTETWSSGLIAGVGANWEYSGNGAGPNYILDTNIKNEGAQSLKFSLTRNDDSNGSDFRSEVSLKQNWGAGGSGTVSQILLDTEYWLGLAIRLDSAWPDDRRRGEIIWNCHGGGVGAVVGISTLDPVLGQSGGGPDGAYSDYGFNIRVGGGSTAFSSTPYSYGATDPEGGFEYFVINFKMSKTSIGFVKVWRNASADTETPILDITGINAREDFGNMHMKLGIYKSKWSNIGRNASAAAEGESPAILWADSLRFGGSDSSFDEVDPQQQNPGTAPTITAIADHTTGTGTTYTGPTPSATGTTPFTWSLVANPSGMTIDSGTGVVTWTTPLTAGSPHTVTIRASNTPGTDDETWALTVTSPPVTPVITPALFDESIDDDIAYTSPTPAATGTTPITWSLDANPSGMVISSSTGVRTWSAPTTSGSPHTVTVKASNDAGNDTDSYLLTVLGTPRAKIDGFISAKDAAQTSHAVLANDTGTGLSLLNIEEDSPQHCTVSVDTTTSLVTEAEITGGGTGYTAADTLTVVGGTFVTAATLTADSVSSGVIDGISVAGGGDYTASLQPSDPVSVTGGSGSGATFNLTFGPFEVLFTPETGFEGYATYDYVVQGVGISQRVGNVRVKVGFPTVFI